jgi:protein-tyrosine-phosphatase
MTKRRLGTLGLLALSAVLLLCSCGGGSSSKRLTKEQYAAKADALCAAFNTQVKAIGTPKTMTAILASFDKILPLDKKLIADVKKLNPPANEAAAAKRVVTLGDEQATRVADLIAAIKAKDMTKMNTLIAAGNANQKESKALFTQLGVTECQKS